MSYEVGLAPIPYWPIIPRSQANVLAPQSLEFKAPRFKLRDQIAEKYNINNSDTKKTG